MCYTMLKSVEAYDYVKRDLEELSATVQEEVSSTATALKQKLKVRLQSFHLIADLLISILKLTDRGIWRNSCYDEEESDVFPEPSF